MRSYLLALTLTGCLFGCTAPEETATEATDVAKTEAPAEEPSANLQSIDTDEALVATALMAAPEESRAECTVIGYNMAGAFVTFREGTNDLICLTDDPRRDGFNAACYHKSLEPFMARGRELRAEGKNRQEIFDIREEEVKSGKLSMGKEGTTLHIYYGKETQYDPETAIVEGAVYRYVVYLPFATAASTGLPEAPIAPNHPWIMDPGTHRAHIMISPINEPME
ncbi:hypothetical protein [Lewinella sp. W8]|uniref:hypothetical protein n=1 Tax=Lewinella sp. W8 TaxID=2528208 RepID=UPI00106882AD|nr:hypothetical protein [Lewinella sp. W8]MTB49541.1 hypothetical protein [Lewinella sp. W8]